MCKGSSLSKRRGLRRDQLALPNQGSEIVTKNNEFTSCDFAAQLRNRNCFAHRTKIVAYHSFRGRQEVEMRRPEVKFCNAFVRTGGVERTADPVHR